MYCYHVFAVNQSSEDSVYLFRKDILEFAKFAVFLSDLLEDPESRSCRALALSSPWYFCLVLSLKSSISSLTDSAFDFNLFKSSLVWDKFFFKVETFSSSLLKAPFTGPFAPAAPFDSSVGLLLPFPFPFPLPPLSPPPPPNLKWS